MLTLTLTLTLTLALILTLTLTLTRTLTRYAAATAESHRLLTRLAARLTTPDPADNAELDEAYVLTEELVAPAHDGTTRADLTLTLTLP